MKRLVRFLGLVAGVGAVGYLLRDKLVRIPEDPKPPPRFRSSDTSTDGSPDDLTAITGVGPAYAGRLNGVGIFSFADLATAEPAATAAAIEVAEEQVLDWVEQARQRLT